MSDFPKFVEIREEGPREGFQIEKTIYPIEQRIELIDLLSDTGLKRIQVGSFVSPKYVPQMAHGRALSTHQTRARCQLHGALAERQRVSQGDDRA